MYFVDYPPFVTRQTLFFLLSICVTAHDSIYIKLERTTVLATAGMLGTRRRGRGGRLKFHP